MINYLRHLFWLIGATALCVISLDREGIKDGYTFLKLHLTKPSRMVSNGEHDTIALFIELLGALIVYLPIYAIYKLLT